jgi:hypothetical protein
MNTAKTPITFMDELQQFAPVVVFGVPCTSRILSILGARIAHGMRIVTAEQQAHNSLRT